MNEMSLLMNSIDAEDVSAVQEPTKPKQHLRLIANRQDLIAGKFRRTNDGIFLVIRKDDGDEPEKRERISGSLDVVAMVRDKDSGQWGKLLQWEDPDNRSHEWVMPMLALQGDSAEVLRELAAGGLELIQTSKARFALMEYLGACNPSPRVRGVDRTGWHQCEGGYVFVLPHQVIGEAAEDIRFQSNIAARAFSVAGTAEGWRSEVAALCAGNSRCVLAMCTGLAAMMLEFSGLESGGVNLRGGSSTGKTTALKAAASLFGSASYVNRWRATSNGLEAVATLHNDSLLILDELAQVDPREAGEIAYLLANGQGKQRSGRTGTAKPRQTWQLLFLSAGEIGLAQHMAEGGKKAKAGQEVRLIDVEADAGQGLGLFDTLHGYSDGAALSQAIVAGAVRHHGHAVLEFARVLAADASELRPFIESEMRLFIEQCLRGQTSEGQVHRVCARFALMAVAGELATSNGVTGWQQGEALQAAKRCFGEWLNTRGTGANSEPAAMIEAVRSFISKHEESRFTDLDQQALLQKTANRAGWRRKAGEGNEYLLDPSVFKSEVCAGFDPATVCRVLVDAGCMEFTIEGGKQRYTIKRRFGGEAPRRVYVIKNVIWEA